MSPSNSTAKKKVGFWMRLFPRNLFGQAGLTLGIVSLGNIVVFTIVDLLAANPNPYIGILAYMVAPGFLVLSLVLIVVGFWLDRRRVARGAPTYPRVDLNNPEHRGAIIALGIFLVSFVLISAGGSYKAYEYTDSVQFCGVTCHSVMHPEYTAYQLSSHARVGCVECHVGAGATWYVKSKISGIRQVFAVTFKTFPRPIPTPVHNLRPAPETCEACHWPKKFYGAQLKVFTHYASDEKNTPMQIQMLIRTGGGDPATGAPEGIHWHMNIANKIEYVSADEKHQVIPYIRMQDGQGRVNEYYAKDSTLSKEQIATSQLRRMDCIDCHNRPAHAYLSPEQSVDEAFLSRHLDSSLPYLKQQAVAALSRDFSSTNLALQGIAERVHDYYDKQYPDLAKNKQLEIRNAIGELQSIYQRTTFPEMKVNWQTHPNNIGHFYFSGCFRCHDGQHTSREGKTISKSCDTCHTVLSQQQGAVHTTTVGERSFQHPVELGDLTQVSCTDCHSGGAGQ